MCIDSNLSLSMSAGNVKIITHRSDLYIQHIFPYVKKLQKALYEKHVPSRLTIGKKEGTIYLFCIYLFNVLRSNPCLGILFCS